MAEEALTQIMEAETQAQALLKKAREEADKIVSEAEEEAVGAVLRFSENHIRQAAEMKRQIEEAARDKSDRYSAETTELCAGLRQKLLKRKQKAVDMAIRVVTK